MLSAADRSLAERHPDIPGLRTLLDPPRINDLLRAHATRAIGRVQVNPRYIRLKPAASILVAYDCEVDGQHHRCYAKANAFSNAVKLKKTAALPEMEGPVGPGRIIDHDKLLTVSFFPNDRALRGLSHYQAEGMRVVTLAYKPERRFVGLLRSADPPQVVKVYKSSAFARALELAQISRELPCMPELRAVDEKRHALRLDWIDGTTLTQQIIDGSDHHATARAAGESLARLHLTHPPIGTVEASRATTQLRLHEISCGLATLLPQLADIAAELSEAIGLLVDDSRGPAVLIHGDFYANQVLATATGIRLLDFDELALGAAEFDLGLFIAHLEYDVLRQRISSEAVATIGAALLEGYRGVRPYDRAALFSHILNGMFQLAHRPFRDVLVDWPRLCDHWLQRIASLLRDPPHWVQPRPAAVRAPAMPSTTDIAMPVLQRALDVAEGGRRVREAVEHRLPRFGAVAVQETRLLRHKPGRRALIEYRLVDAQGAERMRVLGKVRAKGLDETTFRLNQAIHAATHGVGGSGPLRVPFPIAEIGALDLWLQQKVSGHSGWSAMASPDATDAVHSIAQALYQLHDLDLPTPRTHTLDDELTILDQRFARLAELMPAQRLRLRHLLKHARLLAGMLGERRTCGIHRDFYPDQVIVQGRRVFLLDLDLFSKGDPAVDLGNYVAHLQEAALRWHGNAEAHGPTIDGFLAAYFASSGDPDLPAAVETYRILSLLRLVEISTRITERRQYTLRELEFCERELQFALSRHFPDKNKTERLS